MTTPISPDLDLLLPPEVADAPPPARNGTLALPEGDSDASGTADGPVTSPALMILLGGFGIEVGRRVKYQMKEHGFDGPIEVIAVDMEKAKQLEAPPYPGFGEGEFVYLDRTRAPAVFAHPKAHEEITDRLELKGEGARVIRAQCTSPVHRAGAGQHKPIGLIGLSAACRTLIDKIDAAVTRLTTRPQAEDVEESESRAFGPLRVLIVSSLAGGTGSSALTDVTCLIRDRVPAGLDVTAILAMPSVSAEFNKDAEKRRKTRANAYATWREIDYFQQGHAATAGLVLQLGETAVRAPARLFDTAFVIERKDSAGSDLAHDTAVFDECAAYVTAMVVTPAMAHSFEVGEAQDAFLNGEGLCRRTQMARLYSSFGAAVLEVPQARLLRLGASAQVIAWIDGALRRPDAGESDEVDAQVDAWIATAELDAQADLFPQLREAVPSTAEAIDDLRRAAARESKAQYEQRCVRLLEDWKDEGLPALEQQLKDARSRIVEAVKVKVRERIDSLTASRRLAVARAFAERLDARLKQLSDALAEQEQAADTVEVHEARFIRRMRWLRGLLAWIPHPGAKTAAATALQQLIVAQTHARVAAAARAILNAAAAATDECTAALGRIATSAKGLRPSFARSFLRSARRARGRGVIDVTTLAFERRFLQEHRLASEAFAPKLLAEAAAAGTGLRIEGLAPDLRTALWRAAARHFQGAVANLSVIDTLASQLASPGRDRERASRLVAFWIRSCRPLWGMADTGVFDSQFNGYFRWTAPQDVEIPPLLKEEVQRGIAALSSDPRYVVDVGTVPTRDRHRLVAVMRVHGGLPYFLPTFAECRTAYAELADAALHVFPADTVSRMPRPDDVDDGQSAKVAMALGLATGFIADRSPHYCQNVERDPNAKDSFVVPSISYAECLAFDDEGHQRLSGALATMVNASRLRYDLSRVPEPETRLGHGYEKALSGLAARADVVATILEAYGHLVAAAGHAAVAKELDAHADSVARGATSTPKVVVRGVVETLRAEVRKLRSRGNA